MADLNVGIVRAKIVGDAASFVTAIKQAESSLKTLGEQMTKVGRSMTMKVTLPLVGLAGAAVKAASTFEFNLAKIEGLVGITGDKVAEMGAQARKMSEDFGVGANKATDALFFITSAGLRGKDAMDVLAASMKAQAIGLGEAAVVADLATSALNAYGAANLSATDATDVLVATVREGKLKTDELAGSMGRVLPIASSMGVEFNQVGAVFAALSRTGFDASEGATALRQILASLLKPSTQAEKALTQMGTSSSELRHIIRDQGLLAGLEKMKQMFDANEEGASLVFGNIRALSGLLSLVGANAGTTATIFEHMADNIGDTDKAFAVASQTAHYQMSVAMAALQDAFISLGQVLIPVIVPALESVMNAIKTLAGWFSHLPKGIQNVVVLLGALAAAAGPVLIGLGAITRAIATLQAAETAAAAEGAIAWQAMLGPIALVTSGVLALVAIWPMFSSGSADAKKNQQELNDALTAANDPMIVLHETTAKLIEDYTALAAQAEGVDSALSGAAGSQAFVVSKLGTGAATLLDMGVSVEAFTDAVSHGTDAYGDLINNLSKPISGDMTTAGEMAKYEDIDKVFSNLLDMSDPVNQALLEIAHSTTITYADFYDLVKNLDASADAFDDNTKAMNDSNKELVMGADGVAYFSHLLGTESFLALRDNALATADAAGRTDEYTYALEVVRAEADKVIATTEAATAATDNAGMAAVIASGHVETLSEMYKRLASAQEDGKVTLEAFVDQVGELSQLLENRLVLQYEDAISANLDLADGLKDGGSAALNMEDAIRKQSDTIAKLIFNTAQMGGSMEAVAPVIGQMIGDLTKAGEAAGLGADDILQMYDSLGILDGFRAKFGIDFSLDTATLGNQIAAIRSQMDSLLGVKSADAIERTLKGSAYKDLQAQLSLLTSVQTALSGSGRRRSGGGGGGASTAKTEAEKAAEDMARYIENLVRDTANLASDLLSKDFRDALMRGSAEDIQRVLDQTIEKATDLGLTKLPQFDGWIQKVTDSFKKLGDQSSLRDSLTPQVEDATRKFEDLKAALEGVSEEAGRFDATITGATAPTKSSLDLARDALDRFHDLQSRLTDLQNQQKDYQKSVASSVDQTLQPTGGSALDQTRKILKNAVEFRDNLIALRDKGFPTDIIGQVVAAGAVDGNKIAKSLLSMGAADFNEFLSLREQITALGTEAGTIAGDILFGADIASAQGAVDQQFAVVRSLYQTAIADAQTALDAQRVITNNLIDSLNSANDEIARLVTAIQVDLHDTMFQFLAGFQNGIDQLRSPSAATAGSAIPHLASGGLTRRATMALIGESGPEAVIPLDQMANYGAGASPIYVEVVVQGNVSSEKDLVEAIRVGLLKAQKSGRQVVL